jgi:3-methyladenine DNA glycosylase Tag
VINERVVAGDGKTMPSKNAFVRDNFKCQEEARFPIRGTVIVYAWMQAVGIVSDRETPLSTECHTKAELTHVLPNN